MRKRKAPATKSLSLHKDGTEQFESVDTLLESVINHVGRPAVYSKALGKKICLLLSMGYSLTKITSFGDMPCMATVCNWLKDVEGKAEFIEWYSRAREVQIDIVEDRVMDICMNVPKIPVLTGFGQVVAIDGKPVMVNHPANVQLAKLQTDSHYKYLSALRAKTWGRDTDVGDAANGLLALIDEAAERVANFKNKEAALIDNESGELIGN